MYDLLPLLWSRSGAANLRCTICCHCFGLEMVPQIKDVRFVAVALVSKWCPNAKMYKLLPLLCSRSGMPRRTMHPREASWEAAGSNIVKIKDFGKGPDHQWNPATDLMASEVSPAQPNSFTNGQVYQWNHTGRAQESDDPTPPLNPKQRDYQNCVTIGTTSANGLKLRSTTLRILMIPPIRWRGLRHTDGQIG